MLSYEQIRELIELVAEAGLQEVEIERSGFRLTICGRSAEPTSSPAAGGTPRSEPSPAPEDAPRGEGPGTPAEEPEEESHPDAHVLTSPIVGTFYAAPAPDAEPYVRVGDRVRKGQVLCIVEAMKLMNEIESDVDGEVVEIYPKNAQAVEFGEPLFAIDAD